MPAAADAGSAWAYDGQAIFNNAAVNQDWPNIGKTIESTAAHEFGHIVHQHLSGAPWPDWPLLWLREGAAEVVGYSAGAAMGHSDPELLRNLIRRAITTDDRPSANIDVDHGVNQTYARAYAAGAYLAHTRRHHGVLVGFWQALDDLENAESAFQTTFGAEHRRVRARAHPLRGDGEGGRPDHLGLVTPPSGR